MTGSSLSEYAGVESVDNAVIYVSDSLRFDSLPETVRRDAVVAKAIAPSTFTASSLPSLLTGNYPVEHGVWNFSHKLPGPPSLLRDRASSGVNVEEVWGTEYRTDRKPTLSLLDLDSNTTLGDLDPPFTYVVHDQGGHTPYGERGGEFGSSREYFDQRGGNGEAIREEYRRGVDRSVARFERLLEDLESMGVLENTLVAFASDHGELLGEYGGLYEHTTPMVPELLEVPVAFTGAGIAGDHELPSVVSGVDLAPTVLAATGRSIPARVSGRDLWNGSRRGRAIRADVWRTSGYGTRVQYAASSVWDDTGGVVIHHGSRAGRAVFALGTNLWRAPYAPLVRDRPLSNASRMLRAYLPRRVQYGEYRGGTSPERLTRTEFELGGSARTDVDTEKLERLGYLE